MLQLAAGRGRCELMNRYRRGGGGAEVPGANRHGRRPGRHAFRNPNVDLHHAGDQSRSASRIADQRVLPGHAHMYRHSQVRRYRTGRQTIHAHRFGPAEAGAVQGHDRSGTRRIGGRVGGRVRIERRASHRVSSGHKPWNGPRIRNRASLTLLKNRAPTADSSRAAKYD
jgi:hypothetical protein